MPIDSHLPQADPFSLVPTFNQGFLIMCHHCFVVYKNRTYTIVFHQRYQSILYLCNRIYMSYCCCNCPFVYYTVPSTTNKNIYYRYPFLPLERDEDNYRRNYWVTSKESRRNTGRPYIFYFKGRDQWETRGVGKVENDLYCMFFLSLNFAAIL